MITQEQRQLRRKYICSSDSAAILGVDPYRSAAEVWADKTGKADDFEGNANTARGNYLEPAILAWAHTQIGCDFLRDQMIVHPSNVLASNFDGINPGDLDTQPFIVEAKSSVVADEWGDQGTDQIPERVLVQTHHAMYVAGPAFRTALVPVLLPGFKSFDFRMYRVDRDEELAEAIAAKAAEFMERYVRTDTQPDDFRPGIEVLKRWRRQPNKIVPVADELVDAVVVARAARKQAGDDCEAAEAALLTALGDAEGGTYSAGSLTYLETKRAGYTVEPTTFRSLRFKVNKPAKKEKSHVAVA